MADPGTAEHFAKAPKTFRCQREESQVTKKFMGSSERAKIPRLRVFDVNNNLLSCSVVRKPTEHFVPVEAIAIHFLALSFFLYHILGARK